MSRPDLFYLSAFPLLSVSNLESSARWYSDVLGFQPVATYQGPDGTLLHLRRSEGQDLVLTAASSEVATSRGAGAVFNCATDADLAGISARARERGADRAYRPAGADEPESLTVRDPDGYVWRVFARMTPHA